MEKLSTQGRDLDSDAALRHVEGLPDSEAAMTVQQIYDGSDGEATKALYRELEAIGPIGVIATNLFRAQKTSYRAKKYGPTKYRGISYDKKNWSLQNLVFELGKHGKELGITFGWKEDPYTLQYPWVLYVDLPNGQVSFHSATRLDGPDYVGDWDGKKASAQRIITFCEDVRMTAKTGCTVSYGVVG